MKKKGNRASSLNDALTKSSLNYIPLAPPDYVIDQNILINGHIERQIFYCGKIFGIPADINPSCRNEILRIIDREKNSSKIKINDYKTPNSNLYLSAQNLKIVKRIGQSNETFDCRISLENILSITYLKDTNINYVVILHCNDVKDSKTNVSSNALKSTDTVLMTLLITETRIRAEEICHIVSQCFQILYTEATMSHINKQLVSSTLNKAFDLPIYNRNESNDLSTYSSSSWPQILTYSNDTNTPPIISESEDNNNNHKLSYSSNNKDIESIYSELSSSNEEKFQHFMNNLKRNITESEMTKFGQYLSLLNDHSASNHKRNPNNSQSLRSPNSAIMNFWNQVESLLGSERIHILYDLLPFIDPTDRVVLDKLITDSKRKLSLTLQNNKSDFGQSIISRRISYASTSLDDQISSNSYSMIDSHMKQLHNRPQTKPIASKIYTKHNGTRNNKFNDAIDQIFSNVGDLDLILTNQK